MMSDRVVAWRAAWKSVTGLRCLMGYQAMVTAWVEAGGDGFEGLDDAGELAGLFEGWVDEDEAAALDGGEEGSDRLVAVAVVDGDLGLLAEDAAQLLRGRRGGARSRLGRRRGGGGRG